MPFNFGGEGRVGQPEVSPERVLSHRRKPWRAECRDHFAWLGPRNIPCACVTTTLIARISSAVLAHLWLQSIFRIAAGLVGAGIFISGGAMAC